jgi:hypothetical protein
MKETGDNVPVIACDLSALSAEQRERRQALAAQIRRAAEEVVELADGFAFLLPAEPEPCLTIAEFITLERRCCPFIRFVLEVEPESGPIWLRMTGRERVKQFLRDQLALTT